MKEIKVTSLRQLQSAAREFLKITKGRKIFAFYGALGAGKTTFIKALCTELGVIDAVTSPSFALVYEYRTSGSDLIYHFDLYRINDPSELFDIGYEDYFYSGNICFIEWPEKAVHLMPEDCVNAHISALPDGTRLITFNPDEY